MAIPRRGDGILKGPQVWVFLLLFGLGAWFYSRSRSEPTFREDLSAPMPQGERYAGGPQAASGEGGASAAHEAGAGTGGVEDSAEQSARMRAALDEVRLAPGPEGSQAPGVSGASGRAAAGDAAGVESSGGALQGAGALAQGAGGSGGMGGAGGGSPGGGRSITPGGAGADSPAKSPAARLGHVPSGGEAKNRLRPFENKTPKDTAAMAQAVDALGQQALLGAAELRKGQLARAAEEKALNSLMDSAASQGMGKPPADAPPLARGKTWPVKGGGRVTQEFGPTNFNLEPPRTYQGKKYAHFHSGIDIAAPKGTPVLALDAGKVTYAGGNQQKGVSVVVAHENGLVTTYHHLDLGAKGPTVRPGQYIGAGQTVGFIGMTGMTTGPHLHFIAKKGDLVNPRTVLPAPQKK